MKAKIFETFRGRMDGYDSYGNEPEEKVTVMDLTNSTKLHSYNPDQDHSQDGVLRVLSSASLMPMVPTGFRTVIQHPNIPQPRLYQLESPSPRHSGLSASGSNSPTLMGDPRNNHYRNMCEPSPSSMSTEHQMSDRKKKKQPKPIPEESKDDAYWERRKRNNESAKRSRELRRMKEQHTSVRVVHLEQENLQLRTEVSMLREELEKLRELLCSKGSNSR